MPQLDTVIHAANRLRICALLAPLEEAWFPVLRARLDRSDSVLSTQLKQLEEVGYVQRHKCRLNGRRRTWACLTGRRRRTSGRHVEELRRLVAAADHATRGD